jgi:hypothetical protein
VILGARHFATIGLMIHAGQVQQAMEHQDTEFIDASMAEFCGLGLGAFGGNDDFSQIFACGGVREGQNIGGVVVAQEHGVQAAQFGVTADDARELAAICHTISGNSRERAEVLLFFFRKSEMTWKLPKEQSTTRVLH